MRKLIFALFIVSSVSGCAHFQAAWDYLTGNQTVTMKKEEVPAFKQEYGLSDDNILSTTDNEDGTVTLVIEPPIYDAGKEGASGALSGLKTYGPYGAVGLGAFFAIRVLMKRRKINAAKVTPK